MPKAKAPAGPPAALPDEALLRAVIYPDSKKIGCVLLQAIYGGNSFVPQMFDSKLWALAPLDNPRPVSGTQAQWQWLADLWDPAKPVRKSGSKKVLTGKQNAL